MERLERRVGGVAAAAPTDMHRAGRGHVHRPPARVLEPAAEVGVLPIEKEALVEPAHRVECVAAHAHASAGHPVDLDGRHVCRIARWKIAARERVAGQHAREPRAPTRDRRRQIRKSPRGWLDGSVGVADARAGDSDVRVALEPFRETTGRLGLDHAVRIDQKDEWRRGGAGAVVYARREAIVSRHALQLNVGEPPGQKVGCLTVALVVDDDNGHAFARHVDGREAPVKFFVALIVDDDNRDAGRVPPNAHVGMIAGSGG